MAHMVVKSPSGIFGNMDRLMDSMFDNVHSFGTIGSLTTRNPSVDVYENEKSYTIEAELPGIDENAVEIKVENGVLTISNSGDNDSVDKKQDSQPRYLIRERKSKNFTRSFVLPKDVDPELISAEFTQGLLLLTLPKQEKALPRKIEIKSV